MDRRRCAGALIALCAVAPAALGAAAPIIDETADGGDYVSLEHDHTFLVKSTRAITVTLEAGGSWVVNGVVQDVAPDADARATLTCGMVYRSRTLLRSARIAVPRGQKRCKVAVRASSMLPFSMDATEKQSHVRVVVVRA